ncbi:MAG: response regulator [Proteobacteria bacterium]|nr:response regulator [Pseudomonadota bacterium]MBW3617751.1 response regulator [Pseudomonadota bacterium]
MIISAERLPPPQTDLSWLRVLVVDDETQVVQTLRGMLRDMGVTQSHSARDGLEAAGFLRNDEDTIDVLITDWNMPRMNGLELLRDARSGNPDLAVLLVTGRADRDSVLEARELGVRGYLRKPFSAQELRAKLVILTKQFEISRGLRPKAA